MLRNRIRWAFIVYSLVTSAPAWARFGAPVGDCVDLFTAPTPTAAPRGQATRVYSGPVHWQCGGSCQYSAALSHLQNIHGIDFNATYLGLARLRYKALAVLNKPITSSFVAFEMDIGRDQLDPSGNDPATVYADIRRSEGLIPAAGFKFTPEFRADMEKWAKTHWPDAPGDVRTLEILSRLISTELGILAAIVAEQAFPDKVKWMTERARSIIYFYLNDALKGVDPRYNPGDITRRYLPANPGIAAVSFKASRSRSREQAADEAIAFVTRHLDQGRNVVLHYRQNTEMMANTEGGVVRAARATGSKLKADGRHAVVIDGYERDAAERVAWFWIKDSQSPYLYDEGYQHFDVSTLRKYGRLVYAIGD